jgi:hypothetical protein
VQLGATDERDHPRRHRLEQEMVVQRAEDLAAAAVTGEECRDILGSDGLGSAGCDALGLELEHGAAFIIGRGMRRQAAGLQGVPTSNADRAWPIASSL